jgi:uncharacterized membrane protein (DUF485 family)
VINESALERGFEDGVQVNRGRVALAKYFSACIFMLVAVFFGIFCFNPEIMAVQTHVEVPVSILMFVGLIAMSLVFSSLFVLCAEKSDSQLYRVDVAGVEE